MSLWSDRTMVYGTYGRVHLSKHVNYPHRAGELYDCPQCEDHCYCTPEFSCLHCELSQPVREEC